MLGGIPNMGQRFGMQNTVSGPSNPGMVGGTFHGGTSQLSGDGMDPNFGAKWNNNEINGMMRDPTGGMQSGGLFGPSGGIFSMGGF
jgi:hypothetical protein